MATKKKTTRKAKKAKVPTKTQVTAPKKKKAAKKKTVKKAASKKTTSKRASARKTTRKAPARKTATQKTGTRISPEDRYKMIEQAAYFLAEKQHFQADPAAIWVQAEKEVDALIAATKA